MNDNPQHVFLVLTERAERSIGDYTKELKRCHNIWMGVSVEEQKVENRIDYFERN